jgi:hypothetical protein
MRALALLLAVLGLAACGPIQGLDPLGGLGGPTDSARYSFEGGIQGWGKAPPSDGGSCIAVLHAPGRSLYGQASLAMQLRGMGNHYPGNCSGVDNAGRAVIDLSATPPDLTGKTVSAWVYLPSNGQASTDTPTQGQLYLVDASGDSYGNGAGVNLQPDLWTRITFKPVAWAGPGNYEQEGLYLAAGFDPAAIVRLGVKVSAAGTAPCDFRFDGIVLVDSVDW